VQEIINPDSLTAYLHRFLEWSGVHNYAATTIKHRKETISAFIRWCEDRGIETPQAITKPILERYQRHLYYHRKPDGQPLSSRSQRSKLTPIRAYFKWLARENHILYNPASDLELPRVEQRLPKAVLTDKEVGIIMAQADITHPLGLRDRAMMETLYSTGVRRMELANLKLHDVDSERGALMVRQGKGKKDRVIPIGERAVAWINHYVLTVRGELLSGRDDSSLFLSRFGEAFTPSALTDCIRE
jgi:integrase/recombinase XerD